MLTGSTHLQLVVATSRLMMSDHGSMLIRRPRGSRHHLGEPPQGQHDDEQTMNEFHKALIRSIPPAVKAHCCTLSTGALLP